MMTLAARVVSGVLVTIIFLQFGCRRETEGIAMVDIDRSANNTERAVAIGQEIRITLPENPTTGFRWDIETKGEPALQLDNETFDSLQGGVGKGGIHQWRFTAAREGRGDIVLVYRRSFERDKPPAETFRLTVRVQ